MENRLREGWIRGMNPKEIIARYYEKGSLAYQILLTHSELVTQKALALAQRVAHLHPDVPFIREAAMLHDIGIIRTHAPGIGCHGEHPYILHGVLGREMLDAQGYPRHALVCERHTGAGITRADIARQKLPLPDRDMVPVSLEEQIICFADKFYSKNPAKLRREKSLEQIRKSIAKFGAEKVAQIDRWIQMFGLDDR